MIKSLIFLIIICTLFSCRFSLTSKKEDPRNLSEEFKSYWFQNGAEINVYNLIQARYGELRNGNAILLFVTEPFNPNALVKADENRKENVSVLKLNYLKKFVTGIYDYSMMTSVFFPLNSGKNSLKINSSSQEWCGHTFMQLLNKEKFNIQLNSYFETEGEQNLKLKKGYLEDDIFNQIRIDEKLLPQGKIEILPSFFYLRLKHIDIKFQEAEALKIAKNDSITTYSLTYKTLNRKLEIQYQSKFPFQILSWSESYPENPDNKSNILTTTATLKNSKRVKYWENNKNLDSLLRKEIGL